MVFDVVATLEGAVTATLGSGAVSTLRDVGRGGWDIELARHNCRELQIVARSIVSIVRSILFEEVGRRK
jgi:hypothetical protein